MCNLELYFNGSIEDLKKIMSLPFIEEEQGEEQKRDIEGIKSLLKKEQGDEPIFLLNIGCMERLSLKTKKEDGGPFLNCNRDCIMVTLQNMEGVEHVIGEEEPHSFMVHFNGSYKNRKLLLKRISRLPFVTGGIDSEQIKNTPVENAPIDIELTVNELTVNSLPRKCRANCMVGILSNMPGVVDVREVSDTYSLREKNIV